MHGKKEDGVYVYSLCVTDSTAADMTSLRHLHEAALAKNLEDRASLQNLRPYTFMANVLIAVNPLKKLEEPDKALFIGQPLDRCPPHPYNIAEVRLYTVYQYPLHCRMTD